jgi:predicted DsbA family dithiol-disulfide isomerase
VQVIRRAFELRPDPVPTLDPQGEYLTRVWGAVVYPMAERMGMPLRLPPVQPRSRLAHEAAYFAAGQECLEAFHEEVFRAFFQRGEDIGRVDVLVELGKGVGLDGAALRQALETREFEAKVTADEELAERLGVHAVPAYSGNRRRVVTGVRKFEELMRLVFVGGL